MTVGGQQTPQRRGTGEDRTEEEAAAGSRGRRTSEDVTCCGSSPSDH